MGGRPASPGNAGVPPASWVARRGRSRVRFDSSTPFDRLRDRAQDTASSMHSGCPLIRRDSARRELCLLTLSPSSSPLPWRERGKVRCPPSTYARQDWRVSVWITASAGMTRGVDVTRETFLPESFPTERRPRVVGPCLIRRFKLEYAACRPCSARRISGFGPRRDRSAGWSC